MLPPPMTSPISTPRAFTSAICLENPASLAKSMPPPPSRDRISPLNLRRILWKRLFCRVYS
jgi:hypothetical protein